MLRNSDLPAVANNRALGAEWRNRPANVLAPGDKKIVVFYPVFFREFFAESHFGLFGVFGLYVSQSIANSVNVSVYTDSRLAVTQSDYQIGSLSADSVELQEFVKIIGNLSVIFFDEDPTNLPDRASLSLVKTHWVDEICYFRFG